MSADSFTMTVDQLLGHYARILREDPISWPQVREAIALVISDYQNEVGYNHEGIARLIAFSDGHDETG